MLFSWFRANARRCGYRRPAGAAKFADDPLADYLQQTIGSLSNILSFLRLVEMRPQFIRSNAYVCTHSCIHSYYSLLKSFFFFEMVKTIINLASIYIAVTSWINYYALLHPRVSRLIWWFTVLVISACVCDFLKYYDHLVTYGLSVSHVLIGIKSSFSWPLKCCFGFHLLNLELAFVNYVLLKNGQIKRLFIQQYGIELFKQRGLNPGAALRQAMTTLAKAGGLGIGIFAVGKLVDNYHYSNNYESYLKAMDEARKVGDPQFKPEPPKKSGVF